MNEVTLINMLEEINEKLSKLLEIQGAIELKAADVELPESDFATYATRAKDIVRRLGIPAQFKGCPLIIRAIAMLAEEPKLRHNICRGLYEKLATEFSLPATQVERNIRHAIGYSLEFGNKELIKEIFAGFPKFTNSYFLATLADYISD